MEGTNKLTINQATLCKAIEYWLDNAILRPSLAEDRKILKVVEVTPEPNNTHGNFRGGIEIILRWEDVD